MALPNELFQKVIVEITGNPKAKFSFQFSGGGSINEAGVLSFGNTSVFVKWNSAESFPGMFEAEEKGLEILRSSGAIRIPEVKGIYCQDGLSMLVLEYIVPGPRPKDFFKDFGERLARLHSSGSGSFGLDHSNYIGSLHQSNVKHLSWPDFFREERLSPLVQRAGAAKILSVTDAKLFDQLYLKLDHLFPYSKPSLLHGDLWSGNFMCDSNGKPVIYDPAVYYGNREMDLAMTKLFGGFDDPFYASYHAGSPLDSGWEERIDLCNLYPLLVHLNLFGRAYLPEILQILRRFAG